MKFNVTIPEGSHFQTPQDLLEVDRNILQYNGASFVKDTSGLPLQNSDGSWTILVETDRADPIMAALERSYNFSVSEEI